MKEKRLLPVHYVAKFKGLPFPQKVTCDKWFVAWRCSDDPSKVTCKKCLKIMQQEKVK